MHGVDRLVGDARPISIAWNNIAKPMTRLLFVKKTVLIRLGTTDCSMFSWIFKIQAFYINHFLDIYLD